MPATKLLRRSPLLLALSLAACGGGGGGGDDTATIAPTPSNTTDATTGGTTSAPVAPQAPASKYPTGYVRLSGKVRAANGVAKGTALEVAQTGLHRQCNAMRVLAQASAQPDLPQDKWEKITQIEEWNHFDGATGTGRRERIGPSSYTYPDLDRYLAAVKANGGSSVGVAPPDCLQVNEVRPISTTIWAADGHQYAVHYSKDSVVTEVQDLGPDHVESTWVPASLEVEHPALDNSAYSCIRATMAFGGLTFSQCNWDQYRGIRYRNLPIPLKSRLEMFGDVHELEVVEASTLAPLASPPWGNLRFDALPEVGRTR